MNVYESGGAGIGGQEWKVRWSECGWFPESVEMTMSLPESEDPDAGDRDQGSPLNSGEVENTGTGRTEQ